VQHVGRLESGEREIKGRKTRVEKVGRRKEMEEEIGIRGG
jgi:hypothetical protein